MTTFCWLPPESVPIGVSVRRCLDMQPIDPARRVACAIIRLDGTPVLPGHQRVGRERILIDTQQRDDAFFATALHGAVAETPQRSISL